MKRFESIKKIGPNIKNGIGKYPITYFLSALWVVIQILILEIQPSDSVWIEWLQRVQIITIVGIFSSLAFSTYFVHRREKQPNQWMIWLGFVLVMTGLFFWLYDVTVPITWIKTGGSVVFFLLVFLFLPSLFHRTTAEIHVIDVLKKVIINGFYVHVLFGGISLILLTLDLLFDVSIQGKVYGYLYIGIIGMVFSALMLSEFAKRTYGSLAGVFDKLNTFVLMPLLLIYTGILYIYFIQMLVTFSWPTNMIGHMVFWYGLIGTFSLLVSLSTKQTQIWIGFFKKAFSWLILIPLVIMFISMSIRVAHYGWTEPRYLLFAVGTWIFFSALLNGIKKNKEQISRISLLALILVTFITIFSPLSAFDVSRWSQNSRANVLYHKQLDQTIRQDEQTQLHNIARYFNDHHGIEAMDIPTEYVREELLGGWIQHPPYRYFGVSVESHPKLMDIRGYDYLFDSRYIDGEKSLTIDDITLIQHENHVIEIIQNQQSLMVLDGQTYGMMLYDRYGGENQRDFIRLPLESLTFKEENENVKVTLFIFNFNLQMDQQRVSIQHMEYRLLIALD